jgi:hypothetical protein
MLLIFGEQSTPPVERQPRSQVKRNTYPSTKPTLLLRAHEMLLLFVIVERETSATRSGDGSRIEDALQLM